MIGKLNIDHFWAVIPAGGAGTRLWPLSRSTAPKFLRDLTGSGRSLLQETYDRLVPLVDDRMLVVTGHAHVDAVLEQLPALAGGGVLAEPMPRDSMAAIGWAAAVLEQRDPDAIMGSFAADHVITKAKKFTEAVHNAAAVARDGWLVTLGVAPTFPSSAYGYIKAGSALEGHDKAFLVETFIEKPSAEVAKGYIASGGYKWNAGMFVVKPSVLLDLLAETSPQFTEKLRKLAAKPDMVDEIWPTLPKVPVDTEVAEPAASAGKVAMVPTEFGWDDVGDFDSLAALLDAALTVDNAGPTVLGDASLVRSIESSGLVVPNSGRTIAVVGLEDIVVVDTPDAVLVTTREHAQHVKQLVAGMQSDGKADLT